MRAWVVGGLFLLTGVVGQNKEFKRDGQIPAACNAECNPLQTSLSSCMALIDGSFSSNDLPISGRDSSLVDCETALCDTQNFDSFNTCVNCLVGSSGELQTSQAQALVNEAEQLCSALGSTVSGSITATPSTTNPSSTNVVVTSTSSTNSKSPLSNAGLTIPSGQSHSSSTSSSTSTSSASSAPSSSAGATGSAVTLGFNIPALLTAVGLVMGVVTI
ncbi:hypothetical protein M231_06522 [Tremella mesenterica]|uniref:Uncharacterized protein n=1 Tax=Tremella mesenterica TaxID=5217 RepID=A0A4Q1BBH5_TREME|nr:hypothetical protein M231_06522 [Tremella mesenterica]